MLYGNSHPLRRPALLASAALVSAALALTGCSSDPSSQSSHAQTSSSSVQASDVTHVADQNQAYTMDFPTGDRGSSILEVVEMAPREVTANREFAYQVKVSNLTNKPLENVVLRATQPEGVRLMNDAGNGQNPNAANVAPATQPAQNGWVTYNIGNLGAKESRTLRFTGTPTQQGEIRQTYDVAYEQQMATAIRVAVPALQVIKRGPKEADICQDIAWNYDVKNTGTGVARNVSLRDQLPEGLTTADGQQVVAANLGDIPAGQDRTVQAHLKAARAGQFASAAMAKSDTDSATSQAVTTIARQPRLDVAIKGPEKEYLGKPVAYQVTVTNNGDTAAQNTMLRLHADNNGQLVSVTSADGAQLAAAGNGPDENIGTLDAGQSKTINATFQDNQGGVMKVDAVASARCAQQVAKAAQTNIMTVSALLLEAVDEQDPVKVGENVIYDVKVTNQGNGPDTNIRVTATLPDGEQFVSVTGSTDATNDGQNITFAPVANLAAKQSVTWKVVAKAVKAADVQFKVSAVSDSVKSAAGKTEPTKLY